VDLSLSPDDWLAVRTSLIVAGRAVVFALPLAVGAALVLSRGRFMGRTALDALIQAPLVLSPVVVGFLLLLLFGVQGPVGALLLRWFNVRLVFTSAGASLAAGLGAFPLMVRSVRLALDAADPKLEMAARSLGAGVWDRLFSITLPLAWPGVLSAAVVGFAACLGEFGAVITFAANIPGQTQTLPLAIYADLQAPGGEGAALKLAAVSFAIAVAGVLTAEVLARRTRHWSGR
jgi:molybdate transport system permease protein